MFLESIGLAKRHDSVAWHVQPGFLDYLKDVQTKHDIVKTKNMHIQNISNPNLPVVINKLKNPGDKLVGRIIGTGFDEFRNESRYMLIEGKDKIYYVPATLGLAKRRDGGDLRNGDIISLERKDKYLSTKAFGSWEEFNYVQQTKDHSKKQGRYLGLTIEEG